MRTAMKYLPENFLFPFGQFANQLPDLYRALAKKDKGMH